MHSITVRNPIPRSLFDSFKTREAALLWNSFIGESFLSYIYTLLVWIVLVKLDVIEIQQCIGNLYLKTISKIIWVKGLTKAEKLIWIVIYYK